SGSVATYSVSAFSEALTRSSSTFFLDGVTTYFGLKFFLGSAPGCDWGRSRTCPMEALTTYLPSKYFAIVFTLVGDSTTTSPRLATTVSSRARRSRPSADPPAGGPGPSARERSARRPHARRRRRPERSIARCAAHPPRSTTPASVLRHSPAPAAPSSRRARRRRRPCCATAPRARR